MLFTGLLEEFCQCSIASTLLSETTHQLRTNPSPNKTTVN